MTKEHRASPSDAPGLYPPPGTSPNVLLTDRAQSLAGCVRDSNTARGARVRTADHVILGSAEALDFSSAQSHGVSRGYERVGGRATGARRHEDVTALVTGSELAIDNASRSGYRATGGTCSINAARPEIGQLRGIADGRECCLIR